MATRYVCVCVCVQDDGLMVLCGGCGMWQHAVCFGLLSEGAVPQLHTCEQCPPCTDPSLSSLSPTHLQASTPPPFTTPPHDCMVSAAGAVSVAAGATGVWRGCQTGRCLLRSAAGGDRNRGNGTPQTTGERGLHQAGSRCRAGQEVRGQGTQSVL